ncbi:MAG: putative HoLLiday junction resolvase [Chlamydiales bacterium]|jgi:putative Holliday junction resolvase|nr:putative HoLLiday junction resolvase [Chlamydiales bacterium]
MVVNMGRILSVDYGLARLGLAISDESQLIARTLAVVPTAKSIGATAESIVNAIKGYEVQEIIIGLPLRMNGQPGTLMEQVNLLVIELQQRVNSTVKTWDERLSTVQAERAMREAEMSRKKRAKIIDAVAAVIILQGYLDYLHIRKEIISS